MHTTLAVCVQCIVYTAILLYRVFVHITRGICAVHSQRIYGAYFTSFGFGTTQKKQEANARAKGRGHLELKMIPLARPS